MAAAVADFRPVDVAERKLERGAGLTLELEPTPDLLAEVARIARGLDSDGAATRAPLDPVPFLVGFAAETGSLDRAADKLRARVSTSSWPTTSRSPVRASAPTRTASRSSPRTVRARTCRCMGKRAVAERLLDRVARALDERDAASQTERTKQPSRESA